MADSEARLAYGYLTGWWAALYFGYIARFNIYSSAFAFIIYFCAGILAVFLDWSWFYKGLPISVTPSYLLILAIGGAVFVSPILINSIVRPLAEKFRKWIFYRLKRVALNHCRLQGGLRNQGKIVILGRSSNPVLQYIAGWHRLWPCLNWRQNIRDPTDGDPKIAWTKVGFLQAACVRFSLLCGQPIYSQKFGEEPKQTDTLKSSLQSKRFSPIPKKKH